MFCFLFAVIVFGFGFLLYSYYRDQKQEKNSYRTNTFHICRIEVLEERDFLSASPFDDPYDDNDDYEPLPDPCDSYIEYNAYSNAAAQQASPVPSIITYENVTGITNSGFTITDAVSLSNLNTLPNSFTFDVTFKADTVSGWNYFICHDSENNTGAEIFLRIRDGKLQFGYWDTYQNHLTETAVSADTWYNAVGTYGEGVWKLYLNGELKDTEIYTPPQGINNLNVRNNGVSSGWFVGQHGTPTEQRTLQGTVSHVAVYRGVMTRPEFRGDGDSDTDGTIWKRTEDSYTQAVLSSNQADDPARSLSQQTAVNPVLSAMGITVKYSLSGNNPVQNGVNLFKINADTGEISLGRSLTSEEALAASYALTITATVQLNNAATILTDTAGITVLVIVIDLDIDSDNNNGLGLPDRSAQEELLEDHLFAPGKVILPNINDTDGDGILDCWDGYGMRNYWTQMNPNSSAAFTPIVISVPAVEIDGLHLLFTYNAQPPLPKNATNGQNAPTGNGSIRIWTKNGNLTRSVLQNYIACPPNGVYTLRQLGWVPGQTEIVLYVEGISENIQTTRTLAEQHGKPNTKITVEYVLIRNGNEQVLGSDSVNYVVAASGRFTVS